MKNSPKAPAHLSRAARQWWARLNADYLFSGDSLLILEAAMQSYDRWQAARAIVDAEGLTVKDRFGQPKQHPATLVERDSKLAMIRAFKHLGLEEELPVGRPAGRGI